MRQEIPAAQISSGPDQGSWNLPTGIPAPPGGRLFQTAINTMTLEIYYRHLPIWRKAALPRPDAP